MDLIHSWTYCAPDCPLVHQRQFSPSRRNQLLPQFHIPRQNDNLMYLTQAFYHLLTVSLLQHRQQNIQQHPTSSLPLGLFHAEVQYLFLIQINVCFIYYIVIVYGNLSFSAPQPCVDGQLYGDSCDPKIYYQCASGVAYQFQCAAGTVWDERIKNCNWDYLVLTSPTPCGCGRK